MSEGEQSNRQKIKGAKKVFSIAIGEVQGADKQILQGLTKDINLTKVESVEKCDIILAFCPIVSRIGTDITAVLEKCNELGMLEKRLILVVLHHTFMSDYKVPDISRHVTRKNVLAVDFLFHSSSGGLLNCPQNDMSLQQISSEFCSKDDHGCGPALLILYTVWSNIIYYLYIILLAFFLQILYLFRKRSDEALLSDNSDESSQPGWTAAVNRFWKNLSTIIFSLWERFWEILGYTNEASQPANRDEASQPGRTNRFWLNCERTNCRVVCKEK